MTVNYTTLLALGQPVTGTESGTWGDDVNNAVTSYLDIAIAGTQTITTDGDVTLTLTQGTSSATNISSTSAQYMILNCTGARTASRNIGVPNSSKAYIVMNNTTGGYNITIRGSTGPTTGITVAPGKQTWVAWDTNLGDFREIASGDVDGPSSSTDNAIARFDGTTGKVIQNSAATIADSTGDITAGKYNGLTVSTTTGTLTIANGKTATVNNTITLAGTDSTTMTFPSTNATVARTDAAQTFTGTQTFSSAPVVSTLTASKPVFSDGGGALTSTGTLATDQGGTGQTSYTAGDLLYYATGTAFTKLGIGSASTVLTSSGSAPQWTSLSGISVGTATNLAGGAAGSVPYQTASSTTSFLAIGTANQVLQVNSGATAPEWVSSSGTGNIVRVTSATLVTPTLGVASATSVNKVAITAPATGATLTLADGSTLATSGANSLTFTTTGATNLTLPTSGTVATTSNTVASISFGTTGLTPSTATSGAVTVAGTLSAANGGTGVANNAANTITFTGNYSLGLTLTGSTAVTLPTTGTLATLAGSGTLTNKTINGSNNTISNISLTTAVTGTLPTGNGGTGNTATPTNGQLLIGNGSGFSLATLTAGSNITITNSSGGITIASTGGGGGTGGLTWAAVQTTGFTAVAGNAYPCNTTSAAFTVTLPASPSPGNVITLTDYAGTFGTNNLTINPNSSKINGLNNSVTLQNNRQSIQLTYVDSTQGWIGYSFVSSNILLPAIDPNFEYTTLLLSGNGTDGRQNRTFIDNSSNNFNVTPNGNVTQGTFSPFSQTGWANYFNGSSYFTVPNNTALDLSTGDFTIECWFYPTSFSAVSALVYRYNGNFSAPGDLQYAITVGTSGAVTVRPYQGTTDFSINAGTAVLNSWNHIALVRTGNTFWGFLNGNRSASSQTVTGALNNSTWATTIGAALSGLFGNSYANGYISNVRITKGGALYTASTYTVPTTPLTTTVSFGTVSLLTCQANRFLDGSSNAFAITTNGSPSVVAFSPFNPTSSWSAATNGGAGYFDGNGDFLSLPTNTATALGSGDFTAESWVYPDGSPSGVQQIIGSWDGTTTLSWYLILSASGGVSFSFSTTGAYDPARDFGATNVVRPNAWNHIAVVRTGNTFIIYVNGIVAVNVTSSGTIYSAPNNTKVGSNSQPQPFKGYLAGTRLVVGTAVYSGTSTTTPNFTLPTVPLAAVNNTQLLCNYANAAIYDATAKNALETVGNAQISTTQSKWNGSSISFDGTGDWLLIPDQPQQRIGTSNFTIEMWVYRNASGTYGLIGKGTGSTGWLVSLNSSNQVVFTYGSSTITSSGTVSATTWTHIAVVREGTGANQTKIYIGGNNDGTGTVSTDFTQTNSMYVGADRTGGSAANAYVQDVRVTNVARYTGNFTPPTASLPLQ